MAENVKKESDDFEEKRDPKVHSDAKILELISKENSGSKEKIASTTNLDYNWKEVLTPLPQPSKKKEPLNDLFFPEYFNFNSNTVDWVVSLESWEVFRSV